MANEDLPIRYSTVGATLPTDNDTRRASVESQIVLQQLWDSTGNGGSGSNIVSAVVPDTIPVLVGNTVQVLQSTPTVNITAANNVISFEVSVNGGALQSKLYQSVQPGSFDIFDGNTYIAGLLAGNGITMARDDIRNTVTITASLSEPAENIFISGTSDGLLVPGWLRYNANANKVALVSPSTNTGLTPANDAWVLTNAANDSVVNYANYAGSGNSSNFANYAVNANFANYANYSDFAGGAMYSDNANYAIAVNAWVAVNSANFANHANVSDEANHALEASNANYAINAGYAANAGYAVNANYATRSEYSNKANTADIALSASNAYYATLAGQADNAYVAGNANEAAHAVISDNANNAYHSNVADLANSIVWGNVSSRPTVNFTLGGDFTGGGIWDSTNSNVVVINGSMSANSANAVNYANYARNLLPTNATTNAIYAGQDSAGNGISAVAYGYKTNAGGQEAVAIGVNIVASPFTLAAGRNISFASGAGTITALGHDISIPSTIYSTVAIGRGLSVSGNSGSVLLGTYGTIGATQARGLYYAAGVNSATPALVWSVNRVTDTEYDMRVSGNANIANYSSSNIVQANTSSFTERLVAPGPVVNYANINLGNLPTFAANWAQSDTLLIDLASPVANTNYPNYFSEYCGVSFSNPVGNTTATKMLRVAHGHTTDWGCNTLIFPNVYWRGVNNKTSIVYPVTITPNTVNAFTLFSIYYVNGDYFVSDIPFHG